MGGSVASSLHGVPRSTQDVDLVADLRRTHAGPLASTLADAFYVDEDAIRDAVLRRASFNLVHLDTVTKVDVFVPRGDALSAAQIARRHFVQVEGASLPVLSAEDTVLQKLRWYEQGERVSERQWRDVLGVLKVRGGNLDVAYMRAQSAAAGLADLLELALGDAADP
ncbi:MAG: hypothetical protein ACOZNI_07770 [Myxococcota bacterium]